jgi:molecular chaperone Hsp33
MNGTRQSALLHDEGVRVLRVDVRAIAAHGAQLHGLSADAARHQADALAAAALLGAYLDDDERLTLQLQLESPRLAFTADVAWDGAVRCRTTPPTVRLSTPLEGVMLVLKSVRGREVYRGATSVAHDDLAAVLQEHLSASSQVPARVRIVDGIGWFAERLPGQALDVDLDDLLDALVEDPSALDGPERPLQWQCTCTRERVLAMLRTLGDAEIRAMIEEDDGATIECNFCRDTTVLSADDLRGLLDAT